MAFLVRRRPARLSSRLDPNSLPGPLRSRTARIRTGSGSRARRGETATPWGSATRLSGPLEVGRAGAAELTHTGIAEYRGLDSSSILNVDARLPLGQLDRTDSSLAERVPEEVRVLTAHVRPSLESQDDLSLVVTAKVLPAELSSKNGIFTCWKTLPSIRAFVPLPTSKA